jgi:hypothetical protein
MLLCAMLGYTTILHYDGDDYDDDNNDDNDNDDDDQYCYLLSCMPVVALSQSN